MEAIVFIILHIFFATLAVLKIGEYSRIFPSFSWRIFAHVTDAFEPIARSYTMATKPIKFLELHYAMTQFLIIEDSCHRKTSERLVTKKKPEEKQRRETARNRQTSERIYRKVPP